MATAAPTINKKAQTGNAPILTFTSVNGNKSNIKKKARTGMKNGFNHILAEVSSVQQCMNTSLTKTYLQLMLQCDRDGKLITA